MSSNVELVLELSTLHAHLLKRVNRGLSVHGISLTEFMVMHLLSKSPDQTMRRIDLADSSSLTASGITRLLNPMEKIGLVQKDDHPRDARVSLVKLTPAGQRILEEAFDAVESSAQGLLVILDNEQRASLLANLNALTMRTR